jgi:hypothetical protein
VRKPVLTAKGTSPFTTPLRGGATRCSLLSCDWHTLVASQPCSPLLLFSAGDHRAMTLHPMLWCVSLFGGWWCGFSSPPLTVSVWRCLPSGRLTISTAFHCFLPAGAAPLTPTLPPASLLHSFLKLCYLQKLTLLVRLINASTCLPASLLSQVVLSPETILAGAADKCIHLPPRFFFLLLSPETNLAGAAD